MMNLEMLKELKEMFPNATMEELTNMVKAMNGKGGSGKKKGSEAAANWDYTLKEITSKKDGKQYKIHTLTFDGAVSDEVKKVLHYYHFEYNPMSKEWGCFSGTVTDEFIGTIKEKIATAMK